MGAKEGSTIMKKEKKRPDGNCNNITLDQTHIQHISQMDGFGIFSRYDMV
jgi:hypothetical protein